MTAEGMLCSAGKLEGIEQKLGLSAAHEYAWPPCGTSSLVKDSLPSEWAFI